MTELLAVTLHASGVETASGTGAAVDLGARRRSAILELDVTVASGSAPTLAVVVDTAPSTGGNWRQALAFDTATTARFNRKFLVECERYVRTRWTIGGSSPSFTFALTGEAHTLYAGKRDLEALAVTGDAFDDTDPDVIGGGLLAATDEMAAIISGGKTLPLTAWGHDLRIHTARVAAFNCLTNRGYDPDHQRDQLVKVMRDEALSWAKMIRDGKISPPEMVDSAPEVFEAGSYVVSGTRRNW